MSTYRPVGVDEDWNLPPEAREALAGSTELSAAIAEAVANHNDVGFDVILLAGQSNEVGYGTGVDVSYIDTADSRVKQFASRGPYADKVVAALDPLIHPQDVPGTVGHGSWFAKEYARTIPVNRQVLLVPAAYGSTGFTTSSISPPPSGFTTQAGGTWATLGADGPDGINRREFAIAQANKALALNPKNRIVAIVWLQGEADTAAMTPTQYAAALDGLFADFRSRIAGASNVPVLVGQMIPERIASSSQVAGINTVHVETQRRLTRAGFFYGPAGMNLGDNLHYTADGQRLIGRERILPALLRARANVLGSPPLAPSIASLVQSGTSVTVTINRPVARFTDFNFRYRRNGGSWVNLTRAQSVDITATIAGLTLGDTVEVQTRSINEQGSSEWSASTTIVLATIPGQVTGLTAGTPGTTSQPLSWSALAGATAYLVEYKLHSAGSWSTFGTVSSLSTVVSDLTSDSNYDYRVSGVNAAGTGTPSAVVTSSTAAPAFLISDVGVSAFRAMGMRKLVSSYSGPLIRIRRSSDNTEQDIGSSGGVLDNAAALAFAGAGSAYITTWYDQSGNARHRTQATAASQPMIVNAGSIVTVGGHPAARFDGTDDWIADDETGLFAAGQMTVLALAAIDSDASTGGQYILAEGTLATASAGRYGVLGHGTSGYMLTAVIGDSNSFVVTGLGNSSIKDGTMHQLTVSDAGTQFDGFRDGTDVLSPAAYTRGGAVTTDRSTVGAVQGRGTAASAFLKGYVTEVVEFTALLTTPQRTAGQANQKAYAGTP